MFIKKKRGFTLTEVALALGVASIAGFIAFTQLIKQEEVSKASFAGDQIKLIGDSVNAYISNHYDTLASLTNSTNTSNDLGPRTCNTGNNTCVISVKTLINEGLLPTTYSGKNVYGSDYTIVLKRNGSSPYYKINGMVTTKNPLIIGSNIRYDLLGQAMQHAGIDSGMTRDNATTVSGYNGSWTANSIDYNNINASGLLAYQAGYGTYNYSVFLRRDGTLPMTGDLNMGSQDINNVTNIVSHNVTQPSGMWGGVSAPDFYANGGVYIASNPASKNWAFQATRDGYLGVTGNINAGGNVSSGNWVWAKNGYGDLIGLGGDSTAGGLGADYELKMNSNKPLTIHSPNSNRGNDTILDIDGNTRIQTKLATNGYSPNDLPNGWGGGVRTWDVYAGGTIGAGDNNGNIKAYMNSSGQISATGNISGDTLQVTSNNSIGSYCDTTGKISKTSSGLLLSCYNGTWQSVGEQPGTIKLWAGSTAPTGWFELNGQYFDRNSNPILSGIFPNGYLADTRGYFIRGWDHGRNLDPDSWRGNQSTQEDAIRNITASVALNLGGHPWRIKHSGAVSIGQTVSGDAGKPGGNTDDLLNFDASLQVPTATENRPKNMALMYIIKSG